MMRFLQSQFRLDMARVIMISNVVASITLIIANEGIKRYYFISIFSFCFVFDYIFP